MNEEKKKLQDTVSLQEMSQDQKKDIEMNLALLQREIQQLTETVNDYKNEVYKEDLKFVNVKGAVSFKSSTFDTFNCFKIFGVI